LSLAKAFSIGLKPGLQSGRKRSRAPVASISARTLGPLWLERVSMATISPGLGEGLRWRAGGCEALASPDKTASWPGPDWGRVAESPLLAGLVEPPDLGPRLSMSKIALFREANAFHADIARELDGPATRFGTKFWNVVVSLRPQGSWIAGAEGPIAQHLETVNLAVLPKAGRGPRRQGCCGLNGL
jgi:hypothetical protein